jgi:hypothetical protein
MRMSEEFTTETRRARRKFLREAQDLYLLRVLRASVVNLSYGLETERSGEVSP